LREPRRLAGAALYEDKVSPAAGAIARGSVFLTETETETETFFPQLFRAFPVRTTKHANKHANRKENELMRALTRIPIALLLGILITGGAWAQTADQNATPNTAPGPQMKMGRRGDGQRGFERMAQQLNLTDQQKTQMQSLMQNQRLQAQAVRNDSSLTPQQKQDKLKQLRETNHQQMMAILTPEQQQKVEQFRSEHPAMGKGRMGRGRMGPGGGLAALNLTSDQKSKLEPIFQSSRQQLQAVRNDSSLTPEQKQAKISEIRQNTQSQINGILTPEQQQQWQQMHQMRQNRRGKQAPPPSGF
jgi:Spy/CpxP family protein refolding chaperone